MLLPDEQTSSTTATAAVSTPAAAASSSASSSSSTDGRVPFRCVPSTFAEDLPHSAHATAASYACATSLAKAREVWSRVKNETDVLIAADTVVVRDGTILEKPAGQQPVTHSFEERIVMIQLIAIFFLTITFSISSVCFVLLPHVVQMPTPLSRC